MFKPRVIVKTRVLVQKKNIGIWADKKNVDTNKEETKEPEVEEKPLKQAKKEKETKPKTKNKSTKKNKDMAINEEQISAAEERANILSDNVKVVKKDRGLIERTESSKIILTEDNRQVLND